MCRKSMKYFICFIIMHQFKTVNLLLLSRLGSMVQLHERLRAKDYVYGETDDKRWQIFKFFWKEQEETKLPSKE